MIFPWRSENNCVLFAARFCADIAVSMPAQRGTSARLAAAPLGSKHGYVHASLTRRRVTRAPRARCELRYGHAPPPPLHPLRRGKCADRERADGPADRFRARPALVGPKLKP